jgi:hypothetical protein
MTSSNLCEHGVVLQLCPRCKEAFRQKRRVERRRSTSYSGRKTPDNSDSFFGHTWPEWFAMRDAGAAIILEHARAREFLTYPELWAGVRSRVDFEIGHPWRQIPILLGYISDYTFEEIGLFMTALVVDGDPEVGPSEGFFRLAAQSGALPEADSPPMGMPWKGMTARQRAFWRDQVDRIFEKSDQI